MMLSLDNCLAANRPLTFVVTENDIELLKHIMASYKKDDWYVYSSTLSDLIPLQLLLKDNFVIAKGAAKMEGEILDYILRKDFEFTNQFTKIIFLDAQMYIGDSQNIRRIKDIISRYQLDENFSLNMIFVSQIVCVPMPLERLGELVFFDLPDEKQIKEISDKITKKLELKDDQMPNVEVLNNLKGLTTFEAEQAYLQSYCLYHKIELNFIRDFKKNAIAKTDLLSLLETDITFDDIGGMDNLKKWIIKSYGGWTVEGKNFGLPLLKGLLLIGLPGTGKSLTMKAIGNEWKLPVISFDPSRIFSSRVGESENNMIRVLKIVENMAPCLLSIDELEKAFAGMQSSTFSDAGVTSRVIRSFLIWMQDCIKPIFIIATANNIQYLPPELINRFDETFFVNLPQDFERREIYKIHIEKLNRDPNKFDLELLSKESVDLSGREIEQVLRESMYDAYHEGKDINTDVIRNVISKKTNLLTSMSEQLHYLLKWVGYDSNKNDGIRARFASTSSSIEMSRVQSEINTIIKDIENKKSFNS